MDWSRYAAYRLHLGEEALVYRLAYNGDVVAFKMGRGRGTFSTRFRNVWHGRDALQGAHPYRSPAKRLGPITPTVYTNGSTLTETKVFVSVLFFVRTFLGQECIRSSLIDIRFEMVSVIDLPAL